MQFSVPSRHPRLLLVVTVQPKCADHSPRVARNLLAEALIPLTEGLSHRVVDEDVALVFVSFVTSAAKDKEGFFEGDG